MIVINIINNNNDDDNDNDDANGSETATDTKPGRRQTSETLRGKVKTAPPVEEAAVEVSVGVLNPAISETL